MIGRIDWLRFVVVALAVFGFMTSRAAAQDLVTNGSFETPVVPIANGSGIEIGAPANLDGWTLDSGSIDLIAARGYYQVAVGSQCVFLSGGYAGSIYQDLNTIPGKSYRVKFAMSGDPGKPNWPLVKHMRVDWGNTTVATPTFDITSTTPANMGWVYHEYVVTATTNVTRLRFSSLDFDPTGPALDDVSVTPSYSVCPLYDQTKAVKSGATIPIKIQVCDAGGANLSSPTLTVHATGVTQVSNAAPGTLQDAGNANPDFDFRYDATLGGTGGYIYNLKTTGLSTGTYQLNFVIGGGTTTYSVQFSVR